MPKLHECNFQRSMVGNQMVVAMGVQRNAVHELTLPIIEWLREQVDYCRDAPDRIPAGYCFNHISDTRPFAPRGQSIEAGIIDRERGPINYRRPDTYVDPANKPVDHL